MASLIDTSLYTYKAGGTSGSGADYVVRLSNRYSTEIAAILGLTAISPGSPVVGEKVTVNQAVRQGQLVKLRANLRKTTGKGRASVNIVCDTSVVQDAVSKLTEKTWGPYTIVSVTGIPKARYF